MDAINLSVLQQLQEYAQKYFAAIVETNSVDGECVLKAGKYSAKEIAVMSCALPVDAIYDETVEISTETFRCKFPYRRIFIILADWESMSRAGKLKAVFEIGEVEEKSAKILLNEKSALGAYVTKGMKVQRLEGNWWMPRKLPKGETMLYYELKGVMFPSSKTTFADLSKPEARKKMAEWCKEFNDTKMVEMVLGYIAAHPESEFTPYYTEVLSRAGISTETGKAKSIMEAAREEKRKRDEEEAREFAERKAREEEARRKRQEMEARVKQQMTEKLAKAKEDFVSGNKVSEEDFEDIAASVGYEINIRTLGTLRKRVVSVWMKNDDDPWVGCTGRSSGLDGTYEAVREVYGKVKELAAQATETPRIPQETAEPANVSAEEENEAIKHISEIMETCRTWDNETRDYTDEYKYYEWLANHIPEYEATNKNITEIILEEVRERIATAATLNAHGVPECDIEGAVCAVVNRLAKIEDILQFYSHTEPPQPPTTPTDRQTIKPQEKRAQTARKEPKRTVQIFLMVQRPAYHFRGLTKMVVPRLARNVPRRCSTVRLPPVRGDCKK